MENNISVIDNKTLSMEQVKNIRHNFDEEYETQNNENFFDNMQWDENTILSIGDKCSHASKDGIEYDVYELHCDYHLGYAICIDNNIKYLVYIYEPHACYLRIEKDLFECHGHSEEVSVSLDTGEYYIYCTY